MTIKYMNDLTTAFSFLSTALDILPKVAEVFTKVQEIEREHEHKMDLKYSEQEYLKTVLALYQSRKITGTEAKKALSLIFRDDPITVTSINTGSDIELELYKLMGR